jgi:hypothetical protein
MVHHVTLSESPSIPTPMTGLGPKAGSGPKLGPDHIFAVEQELKELALPTAWISKRKDGYYMGIKEVVEGEAQKWMDTRLWRWVSIRTILNSKGATEQVFPIFIFRKSHKFANLETSQLKHLNSQIS